MNEATSRTAHFELTIKTSDESGKMEMGLVFKAGKMSWDLLHVSLLNPDKDPNIDSMKFNFATSSLLATDPAVEIMFEISQAEWNRLIKGISNSNMSSEQIKRRRNAFLASKAWDIVFAEKNLITLNKKLFIHKKTELKSILDQKSMYEKRLEQHIALRFVVPKYLSNTLRVSLNILQLEAISAFNPNEVEENLLSLARNLNEKRVVKIESMMQLLLKGLVEP